MLMTHSKRMLMNRRFKKGVALTLVTAILFTLISWMDVIKPTKAEGSGTTPSVRAFATPEQLMDSNYFNLEGNNEKAGSILFGRNNGNAMSWYIAGKDSGNNGNNIVLFAKQGILNGVSFSNDSSDTKSYDSSWGCNYESNPTNVYINHYGGSNLRAELKKLENNTDYFSSSEQNLMLPTSITTEDTCNNTTYTTTDKLYAAFAENSSPNAFSKKIFVGSNNGLTIDIPSYCGSLTWLRTPINSRSVYYVLPSTYAHYIDIIDSPKPSGIVTVPAFDLNLSSVLFASAVPPQYQKASETITSGSAMTLRLNGNSELAGSSVDFTSDEINVYPESGQTIYLAVQGNDGTNDWYMKSTISSKSKFSADDVKRIANLNNVPDLTKCKIWIEITKDNLTYAKMADSSASSMDKVAAPTADIASGTYTSNQSITLDCTTEGADIYYTTDGSTPSTSSTKYTESIPVNGIAGSSVTTTIKAFAVKNGMKDSEIEEFSYIINLPEKHGHLWNDAWNYNKDYHWHECTSEGCPITEDSEKDGYYQHTSDNGTVTVEATKDSTGVKIYKCKICNYEMYIEIIPATGSTTEDNTDNGTTNNSSTVGNTNDSPVNDSQSDSEDPSNDNQNDSEDSSVDNQNNNKDSSIDNQNDNEDSSIDNQNNNEDSDNRDDYSNTREPKTGDFSSIKLYQIVFVIAFLGYVLLCFEKRVSEEKKKKRVKKWILWAKNGSFFRRYLAMALIFIYLAYYHSIGKSEQAEHLKDKFDV